MKKTIFSLILLEFACSMFAQPTKIGSQTATKEKVIRLGNRKFGE
jgi:hypothetical protein